MRGRVLVDTNLLVLLIVGKTSMRFVDVHKRTRAYTIDDYILLESLVSGAVAHVTTPNILSETSNLIRQFDGRPLAAVMSVFKIFIRSCSEIYVPSKEAVEYRHFDRLGLTDSAILELQHGDVTLLTDDLDLYLASALSHKKVINFTHERERRTI